MDELNRVDFLPSCKHVWQPVTDITKPPHQWLWICRECEETHAGRPPGAFEFASLKELEAMVDSSLRVADKVVEDNQSVKGELWLMRNSIWDYWPYQFQILYHIFHGEPFVLLFRYRDRSAPKGYVGAPPRPGMEPWGWKPVPDTNTYGQMLKSADVRRVVER